MRRPTRRSSFRTEQRRAGGGDSHEDVAFEIGPWLRDTVAGKIDGELVEKYATVHDGARIEIVTDQSDEYLTVLRPLRRPRFAQALQRLHPEATLTIGPRPTRGSTTT